MNKFHRSIAVFTISVVTTTSVAPPPVLGQQFEQFDVGPIHVVDGGFASNTYLAEFYPLDTSHAAGVYAPLMDNTFHPSWESIVSVYETHTQDGEPFEGEIIDIEIVSDVVLDGPELASQPLAPLLPPGKDAAEHSDTPTNGSKPASRGIYTHQAVVNALSSDLDNAVQRLMEIHAKPSPYAEKLANIERQIQEINQLSRKRTQIIRRLNQKTDRNVQKVEEGTLAVAELRDSIERNSDDLKKLAVVVEKATHDGAVKMTESTNKAISRLQQSIQRDSHALLKRVATVEQRLENSADNPDGSTRADAQALDSIRQSLEQQNQSFKRLAEAARVAKSAEKQSRTTLESIQAQITKAFERLDTSESQTTLAINRLKSTLDTSVTEVLKRITQNERSFLKATKARSKSIKPQTDDLVANIKSIQRTVEQQNQSLRRLAEAIRKSRQDGSITQKLDQTSTKQQDAIRQLAQAVNKLQQSVDRQSRQLTKTVNQVTQLQDAIRQKPVTPSHPNAPQIVSQLGQQSKQLQQALQQLNTIQQVIESTLTKHNARNRDDVVTKRVKKEEETLKQLIHRIQEATK